MHRALVCVSAICAASLASAEMERSTPESQGVPSAAIAAWLDACEAQFNGVQDGRLHGFVLLRHGKTIAEGTWSPNDTLNEPVILYSHSKSFTSTAIGFLVDEGRLDLDARVIDLFPDETPENPSANLRALRVRDLLTMNAGAEKDHTISKNRRGWVRAFLAKDFQHAPGTAFRYDSDATYMLAAIVEKISGQGLMAFLKPRLFDRIGITQARSNVSPEGIACGGWGMSMTTRELARFGQFYLQRGRWGREQILSSEWIDLATARQTWSGAIKIQGQLGEDGSDWARGYGFQFWRCSHGAYRADGAYGKYTIVLPKEDAVLSIHAGLRNMQGVLDLVWKHLLPAMGREPLPENADASRTLARRCAALSIPPVAGGTNGVERFFGTYLLRENARGHRAIELALDDRGYLSFAVTGRGVPSLNPVGSGEWVEGNLHLETERYEALGAIVNRQRTRSSAGIGPDGSLRITSMLTDMSGVLELTFAEIDGKMTVKGGLRYVIGSTEFVGTRKAKR